MSGYCTGSRRSHAKGAISLQIENTHRVGGLHEPELVVYGSRGCRSANGGLLEQQNHKYWAEFVPKQSFDVYSYYVYLLCFG